MNKLMNRFMCVAAFATLLGSASAVDAASKRCTVGIAPASCTTGWVRANSSSHHVHVSVSSWQTWYVTDIDTRVRVARGTNGVFGTERTITGLYGRYTASISNRVTAVLIGGSITIHNN